ncbi:ion transporter [Streptomyces sp. NPDC101118]|uniref:ion transporter n=1 Tax=Streptomyces sp. NPDC101118 TaxID=3366109 RepID=UPI0037F29E9C
MTPPVTTRGPGRARFAARCRKVTDDQAFGFVVFTVILANAALLGVETYRGFALAHREVLGLAEHGCMAVFAVEMMLRIGAHADRPKAFFRDPWNVFDLVVVVSAFVPAAQENATALRLLRLARVLRTARFLPQLRVMLVAVGRSLPGTVSFLFVGALVVYVYAMVGWVCFARSDPEHYGSLGRAALTLFLLTMMEGLGDAVHAGLAISRLSLVYYASFVLFASFVLVNMLIGVVINSMDEARELEKEEKARQEERIRSRAKEERGAAGIGAVPGAVPAAGAGPDAPLPASADEVRERIARARRALDDLEASLALPAGAGERPLEASGRLG